MRPVCRLAISLCLLPACSLISAAQSWQAPTLYPAGVDAITRIATADLLGVQSSDALAITAANNLELFANDSAGHLSPTAQPVRGNVTAVAAAKFSGTLMDDLLVISSATPSAPLQLMLLPSQGGRTFGTAVAIAPQLNLGATCQLYAADFNGDGVPDVLIFCSGSNNLLIGTTGGKGDFSFSTVPGFLDSGRVIQNVAPGDLDGDGLADIVVQSSSTYSPTVSRVDVLWNSTAGTFSPQLNYISQSDASALYVAKVDGHPLANLITGSGIGVSVFADEANRAVLTQSSALEIPSSCSVTSLSSGRMINIKYSLGQDMVAAATCNGQNQLLVFQNAAQTTLTVAPTLSAAGGVPALSLTISAANSSGTVIPTGTVNVKLGTATLQQTLGNGSAEFNPQPSQGANMLQVSYSGDSNSAGASQAVDIVLTDNTTPTGSTPSFVINGPTITPASNLLVGSPYTVTAAVQQTSSGNPNVLTAPSGSITFSDNGVAIATVQGVSSESLSPWANSDCSLNGSQWVGTQCAPDGSGSYPIAYEQDTNNFTSLVTFPTSGSNLVAATFVPAGQSSVAGTIQSQTYQVGAISQVSSSVSSDARNGIVSPSFSRLTLSPMYVGSTPPDVTISSSLNPSKFGQPVTFTPTFPPSANGQMNIYDGSTLIGTVGALYQETAVAVNSATNTIYVTSDNTAVGAPITGSVSVINGSTNGVAATIPVGSHPTSLAVDPTTNVVYVDNYADKTVDIINGATNTLAQTCGTYSGVPESIAVNAATNLFYVLLDATNATEVEVANAANCVSSAYISLPSTILSASGLAIDASTDRLYVVAEDTSSDSWLYVYNTASNALVTRIALAQNAGSVVVNPTTNYVYVSGYTSLQAINGATNTVVATATLSSLTQGLTVNPTTNRVYVANENGYVTAFSGTNLSVLGTITTTGGYPFYVDVNTATNTIYAPGYNTEVFVASGTRNIVTDIIQSGGNITTSSLAVGTHSITAQYLGDTLYSAGTSPILYQVVNPLTANPTLSVSCSPNPITYGSASTCTATLSGGNSPTGTITFNGLPGSPSATVSSSQAHVTTSNTIGTGSYAITASYPGDSNNNSASGATPLTVNKATGSFSIVSSANPAEPGTTVTFTCIGTVGGQPLLNGAYMAFWVDGTLIENVPTFGGTLQWTSSTLSIGSHTISCTGGDANYNDAGTSYTQVISTLPTVTTLSSSLNPSSFGQAVTLSSLINTGGATPTGSVAFENGGASIRSGSVSTVSATNLIPASTWGLSGGNWSVWDYPSTTHTVANVSAPDGSNTALAVTVAGSDHTVVQQSPFQYLTPYSSVYGHTYTFSIWARTPNGCSSFSVGMENDTAWEGGSRTVSDGSAWQRFSVTYTFTQPSDSNEVDSYVAVLGGCTVQLWGWQFEEASQPGPYIATNGSAASGSGGITTLTTSSLPAGSNSITAVYGGDSNDAASTSPVLTQTVTAAAPTLSVATSGSPSLSGASVTFTATISSGPTGTITFYDGGTSIGTGTISGTTATFTTSSLAVGTHSITAGWAGNADYSAVTSSAISQVVNSGSQTITFTPPASPVTYGVAPIALSATSTSGLTVAFSVLSGPGTISGSTLTITGAGTVVVAANQAGNANYLAAAQVTQSVVVNQATPTISWATPAAITYGTALSGTQLNATSGGIAGTFVYTPAAGTILAAGAQTLSVTFTPSDSTDYTTATGSTTLTVNKAAVGISISSTVNPSSYGATVTFTFTFTGVSGGAVPTGLAQITDGASNLGTLTLNSSGVATFTTSALVAGTHSITAAYQGDSNYH